MPGFPGDIYLAGPKVVRQYGLGPLPGIAMMVSMVSLSGTCTVSVRYDRASVINEPLFARCLLDGFDEVLALAGDPASVAPASFPTTAVPRVHVNQTGGEIDVIDRHRRRAGVGLGLLCPRDG